MQKVQKGKDFCLKVAKTLSKDFINFVNKSPSPYHVVNNMTNMLEKNGFKEVKEIDSWNLEECGKYYTTRNNTSLIAFNLSKFDSSKMGFKLIGAHTDSPNLRLNPISKIKTDQHQQTCVSTYGGGLWHTWFDRDLSLAGRVILNKTVKDKEGKETMSYGSQLWDSNRPLCKIPTLAIHLTNAEERKHFAPNKESHLKPVLSSEIYTQLTGQKEPENLAPIHKRHYWGLVNLIAKDLNVAPENIEDLELSFYDDQKSQLFGLNEEFISSPRLDNLFTSYFATRSLCETSNTGKDQNTNFVDMVCLFDHEEIGSRSHQGADSKFVTATVQRIFDKINKDKDNSKELYERCMKKSFIISADMAHGVHPNYSSKHQCQHKPQVNGGICLKTNFNQRYMTDGASGSILRVLAKNANVPIQEFVVKNDSGCGSTIGPALASGLGAKTVDIGGVQWGMHSIRETTGVLDGQYYSNLFNEFFNNFEKIDHSWFEK